ncbi:MAG: universal stress protein [bacterium]|nr:universal stress protein [bacterium]
MNSIRTIVVPYDFSEHSDVALDVADGLAQQLDADLHLLHVLQPPSYVYSSEFGMGFSIDEDGDSRSIALDACEERLDAVAARCGTQLDRIRVHAVEGAGVASSIDTEAGRLGADLIAMGTHGRSGLAHLLMGSVAEETIRCAPCPVLAVPRAPGPRVQAVKWETTRRRMGRSLA